MRLEGGVADLAAALVHTVVMLVVMGGAAAVLTQGSRRLKLLWIGFVVVAIWRLIRS